MKGYVGDGNDRAWCGLGVVGAGNGRVRWGAWNGRVRWAGNDGLVGIVNGRVRWGMERSFRGCEWKGQ